MIRLRQIKVNVDKNSEEEIIEKISKRLRVKKEEILSFTINKQSIDAREKPNLYFVYEILVEIKNEEKLLKHNKNDAISSYQEEEFQVETFGTKSMKNRPIVVGSGPAGLFCAYLLSFYGYKPIIIERGSDIKERVKDIETFWNENKLNVNSNVQFGLGGAGTFSDGKLNTLVKDKRHIGKKVFEIFVECGAPKEIMYVSKPHIGTDLLRVVIDNLKNKIIELGGEFRFQTCLTDIMIKDKKIKEIEVNHNESIACEHLILAIGHSARDTFEMLVDKKIEMTSKPFAVGIRIEHPQEMINESQYGIKQHKELGAASYKLAYKTKEGKGVYSFCMCPGGYVVNASSEQGRLAINGMSNHKRDSKNANSAILVTVDENDFGKGVLDGVEFQRRLEEKAYNIGKGKIPVQLYKDFKENKTSTSLGSVEPIFKGNYTLSNMNEILPKKICDALKEGIDYFDTKIKGFNRDDAILAAIESRSSSPVRIIRDEHFTSNIKGIYPCGEGAGYAGGITTSAMDGIKVAEQIISEYKNEDII